MRQSVTIIPPIELELDEIDGRNTYSDVEEYLANRSAADEYSDAERAADCDVLKTSEKNKSSEKTEWGKGTIDPAIMGKFGKCRNKCESSRKKRFRTNERKISAGARHGKIAETACAYLFGDYEQRRGGMSPGRETRMFRMRGYFSLYGRLPSLHFGEK